MDPLTTTGLTFGFITTLAAIVRMAAQLLAAWAVHRRRVGFEDWKLAMQTDDGKIWFRAYQKDLHSPPRRGNSGISKEAGV